MTNSSTVDWNESCWARIWRISAFSIAYAQSSPSQNKAITGGSVFGIINLFFCRRRREESSVHDGCGSTATKLIVAKSKRFSIAVRRINTLWRPFHLNHSRTGRMKTCIRLVLTARSSHNILSVTGKNGVYGRASCDVTEVRLLLLCFGFPRRYQKLSDYLTSRR